MLARAALVGSALCFGLMAVLGRMLSRPGMGFSAGHLSVLRFLVGILVCLVVFRISPRLHAPSNYWLLITRGITGGLVVVLYFDALAHIHAGEAGIIYNLFPVFATIMSLYFFRERPTVHLLLAVLLTSAGWCWARARWPSAWDGGNWRRWRRRSSRPPVPSPCAPCAPPRTPPRSSSTSVWWGWWWWRRSP
jgi:drug/metabolite transporter (DMT)-like permease